MKRLIKKITPHVARIDLRVALAVSALIGVATAIAGCAMEADGQAHIATTFGYAALDAYRAAQAAMQLPLAQWLREGIAGNLTSFGDNTQARGFALMLALPLFATATARRRLRTRSQAISRKR